MRIRRGFGRAPVLVTALASAVFVLSAGPLVTPALAATPHYVGIVISGDKTACVRWTSGITGDDVLNDVASVDYRQDGLIVQIDGAPSPAKADATHYWSYWHNTGSGWTYSSDGASNYAPRAGTVEGWAFNDGGANASPPSNSGSYAATCGNLDATKVTPHSSTHGSQHRVSTAHPTTHRSVTAVGRRPASAGRDGVPAARGRTGTSSGPAGATRVSDASTVAAAKASSAGSSSKAVSSGVVVVSGAPVADQRHVKSGSAWPTVFAALLCVLLAAGALTTVARRRRTGHG